MRTITGAGGAEAGGPGVLRDGSGGTGSGDMGRIDRGRWRRSLERQGEADGDPATGAVLGPDSPAVRPDDPGADREPEPRAARRRRRIDAVELLERRVLAAGGQAGAAIRDLHDHLGAGVLGGQLDRAAR